MGDPGFERTLRHALHTELTLRLRHALLHGLKGPAQTILSALHLLQKKAMAGETNDLDKYANWIKDATRDMTERANAVLPPKVSEGEPGVCDLHAITEDAAHMLRDEAALKEVDLVLEAPTAASIRGNDGDLRLAILATLFGALDAAPVGSAVGIAIEQTSGGVRWAADIVGADKPPAQALEPRYDTPAPYSGIAWAVTRTIVRDHGGQFSIQDAGNGWRVEFLFPTA